MKYLWTYILMRRVEQGKEFFGVEKVKKKREEEIGERVERSLTHVGEIIDQDDLLYKVVR